MILQSKEAITSLSLDRQQSRSQSRKDLFQNIQFLCLQGSKGMLYCMSCNNSAIVCNNQKCKCYNEHNLCQTFQRITVFNSKLNSKRITTNNFAQLTSIFNKMIDSISELEDNIEKSYKNFGLNVTDIALINSIKGLSEGKILRGTDFAVHKVNESKENNWSEQTFSQFQELMKGFQMEFLQLMKLLSQKLSQQLQIHRIKLPVQQDNIFSTITNQKCSVRLLDEIIKSNQFKKNQIFPNGQYFPLNYETGFFFGRKCSNQSLQTKNRDQKFKDLFQLSTFNNKLLQNPSNEKSNRNLQTTQNKQTNLFGNYGNETSTSKRGLFENSGNTKLLCNEGLFAVDSKKKQLISNPKTQSIFGNNGLNAYLQKAKERNGGLLLQTAQKKKSPTPLFRHTDTSNSNNLSLFGNVSNNSGELFANVGKGSQNNDVSLFKKVGTFKIDNQK